MQWKDDERFEKLKGGKKKKKKGHHPINSSLYPGQSFQTRISLLCKEPWAHTPPLTHAATQRKGLHSTQVMRLSQKAADDFCKLQGAQSSGRQGAQCRSSLFRCGEVAKSTNHWSIQDGSSKLILLHCLLETGLSLSQEHALHQGKCAGELLAQKKVKIGCLVLN